MNKQALKTIIEAKSPQYFERLPGFASSGLLRLLERIVHADELLDFFDQHGDKRNWEFIQAVFDYLHVSCVAPPEHLKKIPAQGRLICVANHATGPLDGLVLLHAIGQVRQDVKIVLTDILAGLDNLSDLFLLYDQYTSRLQKQNIAAIRQAILAEQAVIFFPAGEVTKLSWHGIRDRVWQAGAFSLAHKYRVPILPVAIHARNSFLYYLIALLHRHASTLLLSHEMFRKRSGTISITIGDLLPPDYICSKGLTDATTQADYVRIQVQNLLRKSLSSSETMG